MTSLLTSTAAPDDVRVCFVGDSFVAGVGDPAHLGWAGRLAAHSHTHGRPTTAYNLGVRRDTSTDVLARWYTECTPRLPVGCLAGIVASFGVNDTTLTHGVPRVPVETSVANLATLFDGARATHWPVLVIGPPPVADEDQNARTSDVDAGFAQVCQERGAPYVSTLPLLREDQTWRREVREGDGAHPGAGGYQVLSALLLPTWTTWVTTVA